MTLKVVVIGCTHAGIAAVKQILKNYPDAEITVYERQSTISYLSCATYLHIEGTVKSLDDARYVEPDDFADEGVTMQISHDVIRVNASEHTLLVQNLATKEMATDTYDKLIMATGSLTAIPAIPGVENPKVLLCKTYNQAHSLCDYSTNQKRIAIIGGGYVGIELAEGYANTGHEVLLIQQPTHLLDQYVEPEISEAVARLLRSHGVQVLRHTRVTAFADTDEGKLCLATEAGNFKVDMAAISAGIIPQTDLLHGQVKMAPNGAILTDDYMQTSNPDILAAGDASVSHDNATNAPIYAPLVSHAVRQGALAGTNAFERRLRTIGTQNTTGVLVFGHTLARTGLTMKQATAANLNAAHVLYAGPYRPKFMPEHYPVMMELVYDRNNRKVLGAQLLCQHDVSQAANAVSALMQNGGTIDQLAMLDMLFSPNFSEPFNYLNKTAQMAVDQEKGYLRT
ncbi:FAD-dependent oxidoreductase [Levilactobacillus fuyuanensis]|uniref:FAD-dependent oxidoreductase n=1 Tax=Levilactobacillus fuyuanensis TaxID=2486022 RepID=A0ABW4H1T6_9LACO|nr:FAD-dependent oxidoreductase [Levilactobacillus fuyuanensis]